MKARQCKCEKKGNKLDWEGHVEHSELNPSAVQNIHVTMYVNLDTLHNGSKQCGLERLTIRPKFNACNVYKGKW